MPGIFGGLGCKPEQYEALRSSFADIWGGCESKSVPNGFLGGHAFAEASALHVTTGGLNFAVDGEDSLYRSAYRFAQKGEPSLFRLKDNELELMVMCKGNLAIVDQDNQVLHLATEWTGCFPLYYAKLDGGLLFSSHLRPLAKVVGAMPDPIGIVQFMKYAHILAGRTQFKEIRRLLMGQALVYESICNRLRVYEISKAWMDSVDELKFGEIVKRSWITWKNAVGRCLESNQQHALMASAGWDTRLLLSAFREHIATSNLRGYSHGDLKSRELSIARRIFQALGIKHQLEPLDSGLYDLGALQRGFDRVENIVYPYWHRAGVRLAEAGIDCVSAGILGEVIGGQHGMILLLGGWNKLRFLASQLLHMRSNRAFEDEIDISCVYNFLHLDHLDKPWYVESEYWDTIPNIKEEINADIEESLDRLKVRGVKNADQLIEAYTTEYIGSQEWGAQLLSCRANLNIAIPFGDQEMLSLSSRIPVALKIRNSLNQAILRRYAPELLHFPCAASSVNAGWPIAVQETTRLVRRMFENVSWKIYSATHGYLRPKSLGWDNFEFLRDSKALQTLVHNLRNDIFDRNGIEKHITNRLMRVESKQSLYFLASLQEQVMKIYSTDLMLR